MLDLVSGLSIDVRFMPNRIVLAAACSTFAVLLALWTAGEGYDVRLTSVRLCPRAGRMLLSSVQIVTNNSRG